MQLLSQNDPRWKNGKLGTSNVTIGGYGCTITCIAMIIGTTPDVVNERLKAVGGFQDGNLVIWAKIEEAFPGIKVRRVWTYDNNDVKSNLPAIVEVDGSPIGGYRHFVVYVGNQRLYDPWDGHDDPTSDYPNPVSYCILSGKWEGQGSPTGEPMASITQKELDSIRQARDTHYNELQEAKKAIITLNQKIEQLTTVVNEDARNDHDLGLQNLALETQLHDIVKALELPQDSNESIVLEKIKSLQKPHAEVVKQVLPVMDELADAAIFKRSKKAKSLFDKVRAFFHL